MRERTLGKTGLRVSEIGFGAWPIGGNAFGGSYGATDDGESLTALNRAYELGCTFFDTADVFGRGHSETLLGQALKGWDRDRMIIATKGGQDFSESTLTKAGGVKPNFSPDYLQSALEATLKRLGIEAVDVYLLHTPPIELLGHERIFVRLKELKQAGKIRFYGVAIHDPQEGIQAIQYGQVDVVQVIYNLFDKRLEDRLIAVCQEANVGLIAREPLARGFLSGKLVEGTSFEKGDVRAVWPQAMINRRIQAANRFKPLVPAQYQSLAQMALAYPLANPAIATVIPGCRTAGEVEENMAVSNLPPLSFETLEAIARLQDAL